MINGLLESIRKFDLNLSEKTVLTEAATGNFAVTPVIAALADAAKVYALAKDSRYGTREDAKAQVFDLVRENEIKQRIEFINNLDNIKLKEIDILTNTGFLRPINRELISKLSPDCVIPLMWEPWEYRKQDVDIEACFEYGIKVYGTNEEDHRLRTKEYIGLTVLYLLLDNKLSPFNSRVLLLGCRQFVGPVQKVLMQNNYSTVAVTDYSSAKPALDQFDVLVILEHERENHIIGEEGAFIDVGELDRSVFAIHICGNVSLKKAKFKYIPCEPRPFGHMSFTADFIDGKAVIDLHTAGLKVAEGMMRGRQLGLKGRDFKNFMEGNYPALAFDDPRFW